MARLSSFLKFCEPRFPNPLECCLPQSQYDDVQQKLLQAPSPSFPTKTPDLGIEEIINLRLIEREKRRPKTIRIDPRSRACCIDSLINIAEKLHCGPATLHLGVSYLDLYLTRSKELETEDLRFVGLTCLMIASKHRDGNFSFVAFLALCKGGTTSDDVARMERHVLSHVEREAGPPTAWNFLERFVGVAQGEREAPLESLECMASYFAEAALLSSAMLRFPPSSAAAAAVFLALYVLEGSEKAWSGVLRDYTMCRASDLRDCVLALHECCYGSSGYGLHAITFKYSKNKYNCVALKSPPPSIPLLIFQD